MRQVSVPTGQGGEETRRWGAGRHMGTAGRAGGRSRPWGPVLLTRMGSHPRHWFQVPLDLASHPREGASSFWGRLSGVLELGCPPAEWAHPSVRQNTSDPQRPRPYGHTLPLTLRT